MLWNLKMEKNENNDKSNDFLNKIKENYNHQDIVKINYFFHLNEKEIYDSHNEYICTYIIQNNTTFDLYFALKHVSSGEGFIFDKQNKIYIKAHTQMISKLIIDYNNNYLISCSYDKNIIIWDLNNISNNSKKLSVLKGHKGRIYDMDLMTDKNELLSCGMDKNILLWDIQNFVLIKKIYLNSNIHNLLVKYLYISDCFEKKSDKEFIFIYSKNKVINIIDFDNNEIIVNFNICSNDGSILFLNDEEFLFQNKKSYNIILYNLKNKNHKDILFGCKNEIQIIQKHQKGNKIISFDKDNNIKIWNFRNKFCELTIKIDFVVNCLYIDINGNLFCGSINKIYIYK